MYEDLQRPPVVRQKLRQVGLVALSGRHLVLRGVCYPQTVLCCYPGFHVKKVAPRSYLSLAIHVDRLMQVSIFDLSFVNLGEMMRSKLFRL